MNTKKCTTLLLALSFSFALMAQDWEQVSSYPGDARHHPVTFSIDNYGYLVTGSEAEPDFYRYDANIDSWEQMPDFPGDGRGFAYGVTYNGKAYLGFGAQSGNRYKDLWEYDPVLETWSELTECPCEARAHPALIADSGKIWVGTGSGVNGNLNDWWEYDIATDTWEEQPDLPGPTRHHPYYFQIDGFPYVGFGHGNGIFRDFYKFDFENDEWVELALFPEQGRVAGTQFSHAGKGYILSGQGEDHDDLLEGEFWEYTPDTDSWEQLDSHPGGGRWAPGSFVIGDFVYFTSGNREYEGNFNDVWRGDLPTFVNTDDKDFLENNLALQPNPTNDYFQLLVDIDLPIGTQVSIIDVQGKLLKTMNFQKGLTYDVSELQAGIYMVSVFNAEVSETFKLLKF